MMMWNWWYTWFLQMMWKVLRCTVSPRAKLSFRSQGLLQTDCQCSHIRWWLCTGAHVPRRVGRGRCWRKGVGLMESSTKTLWNLMLIFRWSSQIRGDFIVISIMVAAKSQVFFLPDRCHSCKRKAIGIDTPRDLAFPKVAEPRLPNRT